MQKRNLRQFISYCLKPLNNAGLIYDTKQQATELLLALEAYKQSKSPLSIEEYLNESTRLVNDYFRSDNNGRDSIFVNSKLYNDIRNTITTAFNETLSVEETAQVVSPSAHQDDQQETHQEAPPTQIARKGRMPSHVNKQSSDIQPSQNIPQDLELITGTIDIFISRSENNIYQRRGKVNSYSYICVFEHLPVVNKVFYAPKGQKGLVTQYDVTILGVTAILSSDDMNSGKWKEKFPRLKGTGNFHSIGIYMQVMQYLAHDAPIIHTVPYTGVHAIEHDNKRIYGYMFDNGVFCTGNAVFAGEIGCTRRLSDDEKEHWNTYLAVGSTWDKQAAIDAINYCIQLSSDGQAIVALAHAVRCLARFVRSASFRTGYGLYLYGNGGNGKTSLAILTSSVGKPYVFPDGIDTTFRNTVTSIEAKIDSIGDRPFIIDDLHKAPDDTAYDIKSREKTLDLIIRSAMDGKAIKERMNSNLTFQKENTVKTFPTFTGEYFPSAMATSFMRRTLFVAIPDNSIPRKSKHASISLESAPIYVNGLHKLGYNILVTLLDDVNSTGIDKTAINMHNTHIEYCAEIYQQLAAMWDENGLADLPQYTDSIIDASANVLLGAMLIDKATDNACAVVTMLQPILVKLVFDQLMIMSGMKRVDGLTPLDTAITELFSAIAEEKRLGNSVYCAEDYTHAKRAPNVPIPNTDVFIPYNQWLGVNGPKTDKQVAAYIHVERGIAFLTTTGRDALLEIVKRTEGLEHIKTVTALAKQLELEKWLTQRNGKHLIIPCNPQRKAQISCLPLSLERLCNLIYDVSGVDAIPDKQQSPDTTVQTSDTLRDQVYSILAQADM